MPNGMLFYYKYGVSKTYKMSRLVILFIVRYTSSNWFTMFDFGNKNVSNEAIIAYLYFMIIWIMLDYFFNISYI